MQTEFLLGDLKWNTPISHFSFLDYYSSRHMKEFCNFMMSLSNCPAILAEIERMFLTCELVWSKLRISLGLEKAKKT